ncbi:unnamed protein product [Polarella glacialis]|nr:unnamed protein product [Polarella glacialis]
MAGHADEEVPQAYRISEVVFGSLFTVELLSKLCYYRKAFFMSHNWRWNVFDLLVVGLQLMEMTVTAVFGGGDAPDSSMSSNMKFVGLIRFLRLVRVLRLLRLFNVIRQLNKLVYLILGSFQFFLWGLLLLFLQTYMAATWFRLGFLVCFFNMFFLIFIIIIYLHPKQLEGNLPDSNSCRPLALTAQGLGSKGIRHVAWRWLFLVCFVNSINY